MVSRQEPDGQLERALDVLHSGIEPDDVCDVLLQVAVDVHQHSRRSAGGRRSIDAEIVGQARRQRIGVQERLQLAELPTSS